MGIFDKFKSDKILTPEERRDKSNEKIKKMGITCHEKLPIIGSSNDIKLKSLDVVCDRAIACLISTQFACAIAQGEDYNKSRELFINILRQYGVENDLLQKEKGLFYGNFTKQDIIDVAWTSETYWMLIWALDMITNKEVENPATICNIERAVALVPYIKGNTGIGKLRNTEKILDMLDLYYRYHWACVEKRLNPETSIGELKSEIVMERRKGLEWLISDKEDWNEISLDT